MDAPVTYALSRRRRLIILASLWVAVAIVLFAFRAVVLPFAAAALIAYLIAPLVHWLSGARLGRRHLPRWVAVIVIYTLFFLLVYLFVIALLPQLYRELARITGSAAAFANSLTPERIDELAQAADSWLSERGIPVELSHRALEGGGVPSDAIDSGLNFSLDVRQLAADIAHRFSEFSRENVGQILGISQKIVTSVLASIFMLFFMLMVAAFFSIDIRHIRGYVGTLVPAEYAADARVLVARIDRALAGVVRGQVTICLVNGVLTLIGLVLFGVKFAFLLATIATLFSLIPIFGTIISSIPIVLIGLSQSWQTGVTILLWIIGIHAVEAYFLNPKIMGSAARIHPVVIAFVLIAGERSFGLLGALFAVPVTAIFVACFDFAREKANALPAPAPPLVPAQPAGPQV